MSRFFETLRIEEGKICNLSHHQARFENTRSSLLGTDQHPSLAKLIRVPAEFRKGLIRCRILYDRHVDRIEFEPYFRRPVRSIRLVHADSVTYPFKYTDRSQLQELFDQREGCDDILIVRKGEISDSYVANVVFWNGAEWHTPLRPLLPGTMRASLLEKGNIRTRVITTAHLSGYTKLKLINAFNALDEAPELGTDALIY